MNLVCRDGWCFEFGQRMTQSHLLFQEGWVRGLLHSIPPAVGSLTQPTQIAHDRVVLYYLLL